MWNRLGLTLLAVVGLTYSAVGCDACGCSIMFLDLGLTPRFQSHQITVGWQRQAFTSYTDQLNATLGEAGSREMFQQLDVQAQLRLHDRWRLGVVVPYALLQREVADDMWRTAGLADPSVLLQYVVIDQSKDTTRAVQHRLTVGAGARMPLSGAQDIAPEANEQVNFRLSSGSWSAMAYAQYVLRYGRWGLAADVLATRNGTNADDYRYGHRWNGHLTAFGVLASGRSGFMPSAGLYFEAAGADVERGYYRAHTGGTYTFAQAGVQWFRANYSVGAQCQLPVQQDWADGLTRTHGRASVQFTYYL